MHDGWKTFFLSCGDEADPTDEFLRRFHSRVYQVKSVSQGRKVENGVLDKETGERGIILNAHVFKWASDAEVDVGVSIYVWSWGQEAYGCRLLHHRWGWEVKGCKMTMIT